MSTNTDTFLSYINNWNWIKNSVEMFVKVYLIFPQMNNLSFTFITFHCQFCFFDYDVLILILMLVTLVFWRNIKISQPRHYERTYPLLFVGLQPVFSNLIFHSIVCCCPRPFFRWPMHRSPSFRYSIPRDSCSSAQ